MKRASYYLAAIVLFATACSGSCFGAEAPGADERLADEWEIDGESYSIESGFESPNIVRAGDDAPFQVYLPPGTLEVYATTVDAPETSCLYDYPCSPGADWTPLEFDDETKSWRGEVPVPADLPNMSPGGARASATVLYRARETRYSVTNRSIVVSSDANNIQWVSSPADVDELCTSDPCTVLGDLYVAEWSATDLEAVSRIKSVSGDITIAWNEDLQRLDGVSEMPIQGFMYLVDNPKLQTVEALGPTFLISGLTLSELPSLTTPVDLAIELPLDRNRDQIPRYRYASVPVVSDVLSSFPPGVEVNLRGELGTTLITGDAGTDLRSLTITESDVERVELPLISLASISDNESVTEIAMLPSESTDSRTASVSSNPSLEKLVISHDGPVYLTISDVPELRTLVGLDELHPDSRFNIVRAPNIRRCDLEEALPPEVLARSEIEEIGECE